METLNQSRINHHRMEALVLPSVLCRHKSLHSWAENRSTDVTPAKTKWKFLRVHQNQTGSPTQFLCGCTNICTGTTEGATTRGNTGLCRFPTLAKLWRKSGFSGFPVWEKKLQTNGQSNVLWLNTTWYGKTSFHAQYRPQRSLKSRDFFEHKHDAIYYVTQKLQTENFQRALIYTRTYKKTHNSPSSQLLL